MLDSLSYLSHGQLSLNLERMILIDVDDIFVGEKSTRLHTEDVLVMKFYLIDRLRLIRILSYGQRTTIIFNCLELISNNQYW